MASSMRRHAHRAGMALRRVMHKVRFFVAPDVSPSNLHPGNMRGEARRVEGFGEGMWKKLLAAAVFGCGLQGTAWGGWSDAVEVDVELVLAVDTSNSMAADEQALQRAGYVEAIQSDEVIRAIRGGLLGRIAVSYVEWGEQGSQTIVADWHVIDGPEAAAAFAARLGEVPVGQLRRTSISDAITFAARMIEGNRFEGLRRVIDISGDGPNNHGAPLLAARQRVLEQGIVINGLPIMIRAGTQRWSILENLDKYYETCVIGGAGAFQVPVRSAEDFPAAVRRKLMLEIAGEVPESYQILPASMRGGDIAICAEPEKSAYLR